MKKRVWNRTVPLIMILSLMLTLSPLTGLATWNDSNIAVASVEPPTTGFEDRDGEGWTTHVEELAFLEELADKSERVTYSQVGSSVEGRPIHLVRVGYPAPPSDEEIAAGRNILIMGTPHGNEPAGREMTLKLMRDLAFTEDPELLGQLSEATVLFVPTPNPDGREADTRGNAWGMDNNRDHLNLNTPEIQAIAGVMNQFRPDITVDAHERPRATGDPDIEMLWPRNLNVDEALRALNIELVQDHMRPDVEAAGFSTGLYGTPGGAGGEDERILRNMAGLRHGLGILTETAGRQAPKDRVEAQMQAAQSVLRFYHERFNDVVTVVTEAPERKKEAGADPSRPFYLDGADNWDPSDEGVLEPQPSGYLLHTSQVEDIRRHIELFSLETEEISRNLVYVSMNQPMMTIIPLLIDQRAKFNEIDGLALYDPSDPGSVANMKALVAHFEAEGEFADDHASRSLQIHLTAVDQFEKKKAIGKIIKHMESFKRLLEQQKEKALISEYAFTALETYTDYVIEKWEFTFDSQRAMDHLRHLSVDIGPRVAGSDEEKEAAAYIKSEFERLGYRVSTQEFEIRNRVKGQLQVLSDNEEIPLGVATGSSETDESGVTAVVYDAGLGQPDDFSGDIQGNIALVQRGELTYWEKVQNATEAGAAGVIIYDHTESFAPPRPSLGHNESSIPVVGITKAEGEKLLSRISSGELKANLMIRTLTDQTSQNVIAVKKPENIENPEIVYLTAHYDSVPFSPGANDDGSGTVTLLELARIMKDLPIDKEIRFVTFGAEEIGLVGSRYYVNQLSQEEIDRSVTDFQLDMVGTNWEPASKLYITTVDGQPNLVWEFAKSAAERLNNDRLILHQLGRSDHVPFHEAGIDSANFIWMEPGAEPGAVALEPYYHTPEDKIEHISPEKIQMVGELIYLAAKNAAGLQLNTIGSDWKSTAQSDATTFESQPDLVWQYRKAG